MKKFNKTLAIALAAGVSLGGFHVPVAGAVGGYKDEVARLDNELYQQWYKANPDATEAEMIDYLYDKPFKWVKDDEIGSGFEASWV